MKDAKGLDQPGYNNDVDGVGDDPDHWDDVEEYDDDGDDDDDDDDDCSSDGHDDVGGGDEEDAVLMMIAIPGSMRISIAMLQQPGAMNQNAYKCKRRNDPKGSYCYLPVA